MYYIDSIIYEGKELEIARWKPISLESDSLGYYQVKGHRDILSADVDDLVYRVWNDKTKDYTDMTHTEVYNLPNWETWGSRAPRICFVANSLVRSLFQQIDWDDFGDLARILEFFLTKDLSDYKFRAGSSRVVFSKLSSEVYYRANSMGQVFDCAEHFDKQEFSRVLIKLKMFKQSDV